MSRCASTANDPDYRHQGHKEQAKQVKGIVKTLHGGLPLEKTVDQFERSLLSQGFFNPPALEKTLYLGRRIL